MRSAFRRPRFVVAAAVAVGALIATGLPFDDTIDAITIRTRGAWGAVN